MAGSQISDLPKLLCGKGPHLEEASRQAKQVHLPLGYEWTVHPDLSGVASTASPASWRGQHDVGLDGVPVHRIDIAGRYAHAVIKRNRGKALYLLREYGCR